MAACVLTAPTTTTKTTSEFPSRAASLSPTQTSSNASNEATNGSNDRVDKACGFDGLGVLTFASYEDALEAVRVLNGKTVRVNSRGLLLEAEGNEEEVSGSEAGGDAEADVMKAEDEDEVRSVKLVVKPAVRANRKKDGLLTPAALTCARLDRLREFHCTYNSSVLYYTINTRTYDAPNLLGILALIALYN